MKIAGMITEYNPFHNGHVHHIEEARRLTGADYVVVLMSGNYVQRGAPAVADWSVRTKMALEGGADLVLGIPVLFSTSSAESFARAGISLMNLLGSVDSVVFGTELGSLDALKEVASVLNDEPETLKEEIRSYVRLGYAYPKARSLALESHFDGFVEGIDTILSKPNNILGIEYLRALEYFRSSIQPVTLRRWHTDHHSEKVYQDTASATAIRKMLYQDKDVNAISPFVPAYVFEELKNRYKVTVPIRRNDFSQVLQYRLNAERDHLSEYLDFTPALQDKVNKILPRTLKFSEWADELNSKDLTLTRINRALLHLMLEIKETDLKEYAAEDYCMYARILGFKTGAEPLLRKIRANTALPLISKMADASKILTPKALRLLSMDTFADDLYRNVVYQKYGAAIKDDFTMGLVKI